MTKIKRLSKRKNNRDKVKVTTPKVKVTLPSELSKPEKCIEAYSFLIYGPKKIGKTSMLARAGKNLKDKKVFFAMFEPGGKALRLYQRSINTWGEFKAYVSLLIKSKEYGAIVIDTADVAYDQCLNYECQKLGIQHPADEGWGKGWAAVKKSFTKEINRLLRSGMGVFFTSHSKKDEIRNRSGSSWHEIMPTMSGQARDVLEGVVDVWIHYDYKNDKRYLYVEGNETLGAGHRIEGRFKYVNGERIKSIPAGNSADEAWDNLVKAFHNQLKKPKGGDRSTFTKKKPSSKGLHLRKRK